MPGGLSAVSLSIIMGTDMVIDMINVNAISVFFLLFFKSILYQMPGGLSAVSLSIIMGTDMVINKMNANQ